MLFKFLKPMSVALVVTGLWLSTAPSMEPSPSHSDDKPEGGATQAVSFLDKLSEGISGEGIFGKIIEYLPDQDRGRLMLVSKNLSKKAASAIRSMDFSGNECSNLTNEGLQYLSSLTNLQKLNLGWCKQITDDGLSNLSNLKDLRYTQID
jgi:Leucine Rich repeat